MTFPVVATVGYSEEGVDTTTHDVTVPASIASGDLLLLLVGMDGNTVTIPTVTGWTNLVWKNGSGTVSEGVWYKFASGSETNFTYTSSASEQSVNRCLRFTGMHVSSPPEISGPANDTFTNIASGPSFSPSWGADDTMWMIVAVMDGTGGVSSYPANYTDNQFHDNSGGVSGTCGGLTTCSRNLNAATEDPGDITYATTENRVGYVIAIRPATATTVTTDPFGMSGFFGG